MMKKTKQTTQRDYTEYSINNPKSWFWCSIRQNMNGSTTTIEKENANIDDMEGVHKRIKKEGSKDNRR